MPPRSKNVNASAKNIKKRITTTKHELTKGERFLKRLKEKNERNAAAIRKINPLMDKTFKIRKSLRSKKIDTQKILEDLLELLVIHGENIETLTKKIQYEKDRTTKIADDLDELRNGAFKQLKWFVEEMNKKEAFEIIGRVRFPGDDGIGGLSLEDVPIFSKE